MKFFNTTGPIDPKKHYFISHRLDEKVIKQLIEQEKYFVLHAPRQSGKTTAIKNFVKQLNDEGHYTALYINTESAHVAANNAERAAKELLKQCYEQIHDTLPHEELVLQYLNEFVQRDRVSESALSDFLRYWSMHTAKPLVLFFDEFDALMGESLIALLKQFRAGFQNRPTRFPQTICLVGVRDLQDYKLVTKQQEEAGILFSPFNVKAESLLLPNFTATQLRNLYEQHTAETGQKFTDEAIDYAFYLTQGQPWLANALAYQACFVDIIDRSKTITKDVIEQAKETIILRRDTHLRALIDRLKDPRVRKVIDVIISGDETVADLNEDDLQYTRDLGLITLRGMNIANPIYKEIIPRSLTYARQESIYREQSWFLDANGLLEVKKLLENFTEFFRENSEGWLKNIEYKESGPHLLLMAFLQRIINGGGKIIREYALGRKRVDLLVIWKTQKIVIELKIQRSDALIKGLEQTAQYMDIAGATEGHLVIFDKDPTKTWDEKIYCKQLEQTGKTITVWGM
ncbi:ATP-binding protein [Candidatus Dependentiae bacterium]|nr:ATP-binding protein [Candidatus Dependentiae bacterium]